MKSAPCCADKLSIHESSMASPPSENSLRNSSSLTAFLTSFFMSSRIVLYEPYAEAAGEGPMGEGPVGEGVELAVLADPMSVIRSDKLNVIFPEVSAVGEKL